MKDRLWFPLAADFWDDQKIIRVGDSAAILYQRLIGWSKLHMSDGDVSEKTVRELGGRSWKRKLEALLDADLVQPVHTSGAASVPDVHTSCTQHAPTSYTLCAYAAWNDSASKVKQRREKAAQKKARQRAKKADVPRGQVASSPGQEVEQRESRDRAEGDTPKPPDTPPPISASNQDRTSEVRKVARKSWARGFERTYGTPPMMVHERSEDLGRLAAWLLTAELALGRRAEQLIAEVVEAYFAADWVRKRKRDFRHFVDRAAEFLDTGGEARPRTQTDKLEAEQARLVAEQAEARANGNHARATELECDLRALGDKRRAIRRQPKSSRGAAAIGDVAQGLVGGRP